MKYGEFSYENGPTLVLANKISQVHLPLVISIVLQQAATAERINVPSIPASVMFSHISVKGNGALPAFAACGLFRFLRRQIAKIAEHKTVMNFCQTVKN